MNQGQVVRQKDIQILWSEDFSVWNAVQLLSSVQPVKRKQIGKRFSETSTNHFNLYFLDPDSPENHLYVIGAWNMQENSQKFIE